MHVAAARVVLGLTVLAAVLDTLFTAAYRPLLSEATWADHGWPLEPLAGVGCALMGAVIVSRHPRHPLGWLLSVASLLSVTLAGEAYSVWVLDGNGPGTPYWAHVAAWASPLLGWPAFTALIFVFLLSPDGHLPSPRWRWAVWVTVVGLCLHELGTLSLNPADFVVGQRSGDRVVSAPLLAVGVALVAAGLVASAASIAWRLRTAEDDLRRQLLWVASSAAFLAFGVVVILAVPMIQGREGTWLAALPLKLAQVAVPLCVAVAVLRHRLVEIDLIVNRALVLALATGLVAIGYVVVVVVAGAAVGQGSTGFWPSLLATALVALAFQPVRRGVLRAADRLSFGAAAIPYEALAEFSRRVGGSADPAQLLPTVAEAAGQAVGAARLVVLLHVDTGPDQRAVWTSSGDGRPLTTGTEIAVLDRGEQLGTITVEMPAGRRLRVREHRLLADLADQAALAFRSARLTAELSGQVEQLGRRRDELARSRRRLISAADAERSRLERAIAREVLLHLQPLPDRLHQLSSARPGKERPLDPSVIEPLVESLNTALGALREITRGIFPAQLVRSGLPMALTSLFAQTSSAPRLVVENRAAGRRFDARVEAAAYFCVVEAVHNLEGPVVVVLDAEADELQLSVSGTDRGGLPVDEMRDRVEAAGGSVSIAEDGGRTVLEVRAPAGPAGSENAVAREQHVSSASATTPAPGSPG